jgi:small subunit ribosomal protein S2
MAQIAMRELLEAGAHFGHQTRRWNPKMKPFIFGSRNGIYIINLKMTLGLFKEAADTVSKLGQKGRTLLFVGTKRQARDVIQQEAMRCGMPYVSERWPGGMLTNFNTIRKSVALLKDLEQLDTSPKYQNLTKKERLIYGKERGKLQKLLSGVKDMTRLPDAVFIIDPAKEHIAVEEANRLNIPIIALVDTNCDPDPIAHVIPSNDDAIRAIKLFTSRLADAYVDGRSGAKDALPERGPSQSAAPPAPAAPTPSATAAPAAPTASSPTPETGTAVEGA